MTTESELLRPARGTRPSNRRQLIIDAANDLFTQRGFADIGMGDVASAVAIGPSALYRHFRGKQDLLAVVIDDELTRFATVVRACAADPTRDAATELAAMMLAHRGVGVLLRREARNLRPEDAAAFRATARGIAATMAELIRIRRPSLGQADSNLLAWCAIAVANSISFHSLTLPEPEFIALLAQLITITFEAEIPAAAGDSEPVTDTPRLVMQSRRELILTHAVPLFAMKGFTAVSMDDIGAAIGITGSSVYNHFDSKAEILAAAIIRGDEWLRIDMYRTFASTGDPRTGLTGLLAGYCAVAQDNPRLMQVLISETAHLLDADRHRTRAAQHTYISEWVHLVHQVHPDWDAISTRIRVQATLTMINDAGLTPHGWPRHRLEPALIAIGAQLLDLAGP
ncbi:TetR/AcrR family transcriptional regulator [Nocardia sp. NPDC058058]|uniref:TetR/AcrR family transcriptional regulator n=1 Tax=Nocardia sp. NPDC058058 TaxID=3346317 RepID=UPI0036DCF713